MEPRRGGIIRYLRVGFGAVHQRPLLLLLPLLLDAFLWLGPRVSLGPPLEDAVERLSTAVADASFTPSELVLWQTSVRGFVEMVSEANGLDLLAWRTPSLASFTGLTQALTPGTEAPGALGIEGLAVALAGIALLALPAGNAAAGASVFLLGAAGLAIGTFYLAWVARAVRAQQGASMHPTGQLPRQLLRLGLYMALVLLGGLVVGGPLLLLAGSAAAGGVAGAVLGSFLLLIGFLLAQLYLFYVEEGILVAGLPTMRAIATSLALVSRAILPTLGLFLVVQVVGRGTFLLWSALTANPVGAVFGILGNAYIGTALTATVMVAFWDRFPALHRPLSPGSIAVRTNIQG